MATYVPGSEQYLPDIKPFTPDYKFLSAVLDTRQDKYNTNWQATNDVYNKVVYAGLSREDTTQQREQYVNNLAPSLEKIAGMDLSLAQNAESAKAVFAPFFEDKLIVKDMVKTANYQKQMSYANRLQRSVDFDQRDMWWENGVKELQYRMEDFINMSPDQAMDARLYSYTPDADLGKMAEKMLGEMKPPLKIKYDHFGKNPDVLNPDGSIKSKGKINGDWIITTTNGEVVTGPALALINERLADDPRVKNAYRAQAFVAGRDFAAEGMAAGAFGSVEEGQNAWAEETIARIEFNNSKDIKDGSKLLAEKQNANVRWSNYQKITGVIPGSDDDKIMQEVSSDFESVSNTLKNKLKVRDVLNHNSPDLESNLNRAYQLLQMTNLQGDMIKAAQAYSMRDMESTMRETQAAKDKRKFTYNAALEDRRSRNRFALQAQKKADDLAQAVLEGKIMSPDDPLNVELNKVNKDFTNNKSLSFNLEDEDAIVLASDDQYFTKKNLNRAEQIKSILSYANQVKPSIGNKEATTSLTITNKNGEEVSENLTASELESYLTAEEYTNGGVSLGYKNVKAIDDLFEEFKTNIKNKPFIEKANINFVRTGTGYVDLLKMFNETENTIGITEMNQTTARQEQKTAYDQTTALLLGSSDNIKGLVNSGWPSLWYKDEEAVLDKDGNDTGQKKQVGNWKQYTQKEYQDLGIQLAQEGKLKNFDRNWSNDTGDTDAKDYMEPEFEFQKSSKYSRRPRRTATGRMAINKLAVKDDADYAYEALQEAHNEALKGGNPEIKTATFNSVDQRVSNTTAALSNYGVQVAFVDPEIRNPKTDIIYATMLKQKRVLEETGKSPIFYITDIDNAKEEGVVAKQIFEDFGTNFRSYRANEKTSTNVTQTPRGKFVYGAVYGDPEDGNKTTAGYTFYPNQEYFASQVKGGGGDGQYAGLTFQQRKDIEKNGITMIFDQEDDISEGSLKKNTNSNSIIAATIESKGGYWNQKVQVEKGVNAGEFSWTKISKDNYVLNYELETYMPSQNGKGGNYIKNGAIAQNVNINPSGSIYGGSMSILEKQQNDILEIMQAHGMKNYNAYIKDVATYKSKIK